MGAPSAEGRVTRRQVLAGAAGGLAAALGAAGPVRRARAEAETLKVCQWVHFVPAFDAWFDQKFAREWGERHGVPVVVEHVAASDLRPRALLEIAARRGHDLFGFPEAPASFAEHALPLDDVVAECEQRFGKLLPLAARPGYDPRGRRHFALCDSWAPALLHYRADWWGDVGVKPHTWDLVREGARKIREKHGAPAGFGLAPEFDSNMVLRGLLWSFGAREQDEAGHVRINSPGTLEAIRLMTAIFRESMTSDVFTWDESSNNRMFVYGGGSIIQNAVSALRTAERQNPELAKKTALAATPAGPGARLGCAQLVHSYVVWNFAEQRERAKRFLVDLVAASADAFRESGFYNLPTFSRAVPDLRARLAADKQNPKAYVVLADAEQWSRAPGYPGPASTAIEETLERSVIPRMFARAARGEQTAEDAARQAEAEMKQIFARRA